MKTLKRLVSEMLFPLGKEATIRIGQLKRCRYVVTEQSGWSPILGRWEPEAQRLYAQLISSGEVVWDLGANTGIHSLLFARLVGHSGRVIAFEPMDVNVQQILKTCELNDIHNVEVVHKAVSDSPGTASFHVARHDKQGSLVADGVASTGMIQVECMTLDQAMDEGRAPDFIKIDIEGAESRALHGFSRVAQSRPTFAIDLHNPEQDAAVGTWLKNNGYLAYRLLNEGAKAVGASGAVLTQILEMEKGWPAENGTWGTVIGVHPSRTEKLALITSLAGQPPR